MKRRGRGSEANDSKICSTELLMLWGKRISPYEQ